MTIRLSDNNLGNSVEPTARSGFIKLIALVLLPYFITGAAVRVQAEPELVIDSSEFDFGLVPDNSMLVLNTRLRSVGEDTLEIGDIKTGCSCLTTPLRKTRLAPGDSVGLTIYWRVGGADSRAQRTPYLFSNDESGPHRMLLQAEVVTTDNWPSPVTLDPLRVEFGELKSRRDYRRVLTIRNGSESGLSVTTVMADDKVFALELPDSIPAGGTITGIVILESEFEKEKFERSFTLEFAEDEDTVFRISIPVTRGDFSFRPTLTTTINKSDGVNDKR